MKILIIEDEFYAAKRLQKLILNEIPDGQILAVIDTVEEAASWLASHVEPNLIFMDIQLADGLSFQIFDKVRINAPVIFTTAYDEYALEAFKVNSIDYLLKPIEEEALKAALNKYQHFFQHKETKELDWSNIAKQIFQPHDNYKKRFLVKTGSSFSYLKTEDIQLIYSEEGLSFAITKEKKRVILDATLEKITNQLDPAQFFKISRKHIVPIHSIHKIHPYLNNRLKVELDSPVDEDLVVSREKVREFKAWVNSWLRHEN